MGKLGRLLRGGAAYLPAAPASLRDQFNPKKQYAQVLDDIFRSGVPIFTDPGLVLEHFFGAVPGDAAILDPLNLPVRADDSGRHWPEFFDSGAMTCCLLVDVCRAVRPSRIVESGVANGASTRALLASLAAAAHGTLTSFDTSATCADAIRGCRGEERWELRVIPDAWAVDAFAAATDDLTDSIDLWYHDSNHHYDWMSREFRIALRCLRPGGFLVSDDVDGNIAFAELAAEQPELRPVAYFDTRKVVGFARKPDR